MSFDVPADAYLRFMGRFSEPLAARFVDLVDPRPGGRALDVGCGPGAVTAVLVERLGPDAVLAIDPSQSFVAAARARFPDVDVRVGTAEQLPYPDDDVHVALAQLVVHFVSDPPAAVQQMRRVTRPGGVVAASVWDYAGGRAPLSVFWAAAASLDPHVVDESRLFGARSGQLAELFTAGGLADVRQEELSVRSRFTGFDDWWEPYTYGIGPAGNHVAGLGAAARAALRDRCRDALPDGPFALDAVAWVAVGRA
jgi:SAM-dependent methyltransferase